MSKLLKYVIGAGLAIVLLFYAVVCALIFHDVKSTTRIAQQKFGGTPLDATIMMLQSQETSFELKNKAVYALGQIGDEKALPVLNSQLTGIPCPKPCTKKGYVCQYDLEKAISECSGAFSATRWMYQFL